MASVPTFSLRDLQRLLDASPLSILIHDAASKNILWANHTALRILGFSLQELLPLKAHDMSGLGEMYRRARGVEWLQRAADEGSARIKWKYRSKSGKETLTDAIATRVTLSESTVVMVQFRDIEHEERTRETLSRTRAALATFIGQTDEGILIVDEHDAVTYASRSAELLLGAERGGLIASNLLDALDADGRSALSLALTRSRELGRSQPFRVATRHRTATASWVSGSCQFISDDNVTGYLLLFHDVTEPRLQDIRRERELQHLNYLARFNAMGDMATTIEHEIAQPISAASNFLAGVEQRHRSGNVKTATLLTGIQAAQGQLARVGEILQSLRRYVTSLEPSSQLIDLNALVAEVRPLVETRAAQHQVDVTFALSGVAVPVRCERVLTGQVMLNLCFNAIEEMRDWPIEYRAVRVETAHRTDPKDSAEGRGLFRVTDLGRGLNHVPGGRVFDGAFSSKSGGHGIGLALSHQVILRQGGEIAAYEHHPHGAVFEFAFPLATHTG
ncbi:PAS domain S-box protein [Leucobacter luti]|uniref:PAS domain S-box protein n=1 Tax=Leucobacter luti TaxID=340320 RepID=UPI001A7E10A1|nr:PAS domain S-box protein [Leucobacter luti]